MRQPLVQLGGKEKFADYQVEFDRIFPNGSVIDVLGNEVVFTKGMCRHICFTSPDKKWNQGARIEWSQERAERISWIKGALESPDFIRIDRPGIWVYMSQIERDKVNDLPGELYAVTVQVDDVKPDKPGKVYILTAHPITNIKWNVWKSRIPWIYPSGQPAPPKSKKNKKKGGA